MVMEHIFLVKSKQIVNFLSEVYTQLKSRILTIKIGVIFLVYIGTYFFVC